MSHTVSDRKRIARDAEVNAEEIARQTATVREDLEFAGDVVDIWNSRLAAGRELFLSPTLRAAILARKPYLTFYCPACHVTGRVDLRTIDRHRGASITSLIPALSCRRCVPNAPFARLTGLEGAPGDERPRNLDIEAALIVKTAREAAIRRRREED
jgi:uncharacterized protein YlaI